MDNDINRTIQDIISTIEINSKSFYDFTKGDYVLPSKTMALHYVTSSQKGISAKKEWGLVEGCPALVIHVDSDFILVNSLHSSCDRHFKLTRENLFNLENIEPDENGYLNCPKYPLAIHIEEFNKREEVKKLEKEIDKMIKKDTCDVKVKKIIEDKLFQMIQSQGAPYVTIDQYLNYKSGEIKISGHKRFGSEIFNRNSRWCPPIEISYDEYVKSPSYPAPLGVRPKDFCLPSELSLTMKELLSQIYNFKNIDKTSFEDIKEHLEERDVHKCKYCGECIDANDYSSTYKSENNFMEICHRDPNDRFLVRNMYWGHGECNRRQGGYSEDDRIADGLRLLATNPEHLEKYKDLLRMIA